MECPQPISLHPLAPPFAFWEDVQVHLELEMLQLAQGEVLHKLHPLAPFAFWEDVQVHVELEMLQLAQGQVLPKLEKLPSLLTEPTELVSLEPLL